MPLIAPLHVWVSRPKRVSGHFERQSLPRKTWIYTISSLITIMHHIKSNLYMLWSNTRYALLIGAHNVLQPKRVNGHFDRHSWPKMTWIDKISSWITIPNHIESKYHENKASNCSITRLGQQAQTCKRPFWKTILAKKDLNRQDITMNNYSTTYRVQISRKESL